MGHDNHELMAVVELAAKMYATELMRGRGQDRDRARGYIGSRRLFAPMVEQLRIGYAPRGNAQRPWILGKINERRLLIEAGILNETENDQVYDPMEGRIVLPQVNASGKYLGFVGRSLVEKKDKYLSTGVTPIFRRSEILYRIDRARQHIEKSRTVIVVEGLLDAALMLQVGVHNVVSTGTKGMSDPQAQILQRYAHRVEVMFDNDIEGRAGFEEVKRRRGKYFAKVAWKEYPAKFKDPAEWAAKQIDWAIQRQEAAVVG